MKKLNIVVAVAWAQSNAPKLDNPLIEQIRKVDPSINVTDVSRLVQAELKGDAAAKAEMDAALTKMDILVGFMPPQNILQRAPNLKWVQLMSAGADGVARSEIWQSDVIITGVSGIHATPISEHVLGTILLFAKQSAHALRLMQQHKWQRYTPTLLNSSTVGIIALGHIGHEVARLAKAFGMKVLAMDELRGTRPARYVDEMIPASQFSRLLKESDYVVSCVPLTPKTTKFIGEKELKAMKPTAYLINISRGGVIDEEALIKALDEKWIAGAGLDVTATEPLPPTSRLWDYENVVVTPHISGTQEGYLMLGTKLFCENLKRYLNGKKLINIISRKRGY